MDTDEHPSWRVSETSDGTEITREAFPDAEIVCPDCGRVWPPDCEHSEVDIDTDPEHLKITDGRVTASGICQECDTRVEVYLEATDIRGVDG